MATATYDKIATTTLGSTTASITFSSIAASWTDLRLVITGTSTAVGGYALSIRINGDTSGSYSNTVLTGNGSGTALAASSFPQTGQTSMYGSDFLSFSTTIPIFHTLDFFSYAGSTYKTMLATANGDKNGSGIEELGVNLWRSTAAITSLNLYPGTDSFLTGTTATLYGIKAA
jgi:hypothetical protein